MVKLLSPTGTWQSEYSYLYDTYCSKVIVQPYIAGDMVIIQPSHAKRPSVAHIMHNSIGQSYILYMIIQ